MANDATVFVTFIQCIFDAVLVGIVTKANAVENLFTALSFVHYIKDAQRNDDAEYNKGGHSDGMDRGVRCVFVNILYLFDTLDD